MKVYSKRSGYVILGIEYKEDNAVHYGTYIKVNCLKDDPESITIVVMSLDEGNEVLTWDLEQVWENRDKFQDASYDSSGVFHCYCGVVIDHSIKLMLDSVDDKAIVRDCYKRIAIILTLTGSTLLDLLEDVVIEDVDDLVSWTETELKGVLEDANYVLDIINSGETFILVEKQ